MTGGGSNRIFINSNHVLTIFPIFITVGKTALTTRVENCKHFHFRHPQSCFALVSNKPLFALVKTTHSFSLFATRCWNKKETSLHFKISKIDIGFGTYFIFIFSFIMFYSCFCMTNENFHDN